MTDAADAEEERQARARRRRVEGRLRRLGINTAPRPRVADMSESDVRWLCRGGRFA
jgi:hypothetical protein